MAHGYRTLPCEPDGPLSQVAIAFEQGGENPSPGKHYFVFIENQMVGNRAPYPHHTSSIVLLWKSQTTVLHVRFQRG
jgi:hypothetical protein